MCTARLRPLALLAATAILMSCGDETSVEPPGPAAAPQLVGAPAEDVIPDEYIVVFRDDVRSPAAAANEMAATHGLKIGHTYSHAIRGFSAVVPEGRLAALQRHPLVKYVQPNRYLYIDTHERFRRPAAAAPLAAALDAPSGLNAAALSASEIRLTWTDNSSDEDGFEIARSAGSAGPFSKVASVKANVTEYVDGELSAAVEYCYKVRAVAGKGQKNKQYSSYTPAVCATTDAAGGGEPPADPRPSDLVAAGVSGAIALTWNDNWDAETNYAIERCGPVLPDADPEPGCLDFRGLALVGANVTSYSDLAATAALEYCYRVKGMRMKGRKVTYTEYSNIDCGVATANGPPTGWPTDLVATPISHLAIELVWTDGATGEEKFEIQRCGGTATSCLEADFTPVGETGPNAEFFIDWGLTAGTDYVYRVQATNVAGSSAYSDWAAATTLATPAACADDGNHDDISTQLWNIRRVKAHRNLKWQAAHLGGNCALDAWLFVLDTGVDGADMDVIHSHDFIADATGGTDDNGHGTHVAGSAAAKDNTGGVVGVAPGAPIWAFKVCNDDGACPSAAVLAAIDSVTDLKLDPATSGQPMVVNLSLGGLGTDAALESAVRASINAGVVYAISAGNGDLGSCYFPADAQNFTPANVGDDEINASNGSDGDEGRVNGAIVVTASDMNDHDDNCNYGNPVTVAAPGVDILSTWPGGGFASLGGASMATPHVAGAAVLFLQSNPGAVPATVEGSIVDVREAWTTDDEPNADGRLNAGGL